MSPIPMIEKEIKMRILLFLLNVIFILSANNAYAQYYGNTTSSRYALPSNQIDNRPIDYVPQSYYDKKKTFRPYVGIELLNINNKLTDKDGYFKNGGTTYFRNNSLSVSGIAGLRLFNYLGVEGFYQHSFGEKKTKSTANADDASLTDVRKGTNIISSYGADLIGYVPMTRRFELLLALGLGEYDFHAKLTRYSKDSAGTKQNYSKNNKNFDSLGIRYGLGMQYAINESAIVRGMVRYVKLSDDDYIKSLTEFALGLIYNF